MTPVLSLRDLPMASHSQPMEPEDRPQMVMGVYRINTATGEREVLRETVAVKPGAPLMTGEFPPCQCPKCKR
ncbi:hypothetical protein YUYDRAFT_03344 [Streptomyces sp. ScaeMP-e48]|nr:hypothetical protein YUYDRAFT_03344 [Streptomyces sp. ScaeMP-e48]